MKTMIWKEWRENLKWAVLAMLALGLAEFCGMQAGGNRESVLNPGFYLVTVFGNAAVGLLFGLIQFIPERGRDRWATLMHRPVPRTEIFLGKTMAGVTLYLATAVVPFALAILYAALPGHFAFPLLPEMLVPGMMDLGAGIAYYFLGVFLVVDQGKWFLRRALAVFAVLAISVVTLAVVSAGWMLVWVTIADALMALTAWGAVTTNGSFTSRPFPARMALLAVLLAGLYMAFGVGALIKEMFAPSGRPHWIEYRIDATGNPLRVSHGDHGVDITDLAGHPVSNPHYDDARSDDYLTSPSLIAPWIGDANGFDGRGMALGWRNERTSVFPFDAGSGDDPSAMEWYYLRDRHYFVGYSLRSRRLAAVLDREGFRPPMVTPIPFPGELKGFNGAGNTRLVAYGGATLYFFDLKGHGMRAVSMPGEIFGINVLTSQTDRERNWFAVALGEEVRVVDGEGADVAHIAYRRDVGTWGKLSIGTDRKRDRFFLLYDPSAWIVDRAPRHLDSFLDVDDLQGIPVRSEVLASLRQSERKVPLFTKAQNAMGTPLALYPGVVAVEFISAKNRDMRRHHPVVWTGKEWKGEAEAFAWSGPARTGAWAAGFSLLCAMAAWGWARWRAFPRLQAWKWAVFVLAFNLPGLIAFRLAADWPVLAKCPVCGKLRRVDDPTCPHCGAAWPGPERDGTEIHDIAEVIPSRS